MRPFFMPKNAHGEKRNRKRAQIAADAFTL